jgi:hypothetical protein
MPGIFTCNDLSLLRSVKAVAGMAAVKEKGKQIDSEARTLSSE